MILAERTCTLTNIRGFNRSEPIYIYRPSENPLGYSSNGALRVTNMFLKLLEQQFHVGSIQHKMKCRFPVDFAAALSVHVNHLNRCVKETTSKTTSQHIAEQITKEALRLLQLTEWNICEIGYCFGFGEGPHFINFFKKNVKMSPTAYRKAVKQNSGCPINNCFRMINQFE